MLTVGDLLIAPKRVVATKLLRKNKAHPSHLEWDVDLESTVAGRFTLSVRVNRALPESFSIVLRFAPELGPPSVLVRVNGDHGPHRDPDGKVLAGGPHLHAPTDAERALPLEPGQWPQGPQYVDALDPSYSAPSLAWQKMTETAAIERAPVVEAFMVSIGQMDMWS